MGRGKGRFNPIILTGRTITGIAEDSKSVCRTDDGQVCFVEGAVPGDVVDVLVLQRKKVFDWSHAKAYHSISRTRRTSL